MSAILGCLHLDGAPANAVDLRESARVGAHRAPSGFRFWSAGPIVLGQGSAAATPPAEPLQEPPVAIVFDGRLDNRDEAARALGCAPSCDDRSVVLAAYRAWGLDAPARLYGDFVFAIWDDARRRLFCARDAMGQRSLFYANTAGRLVFASEMRQVLAHARVSRAVNDGVVAEVLGGGQVTIEETLWRDVRRLPPAHALVCEQGAVRVFRHWDFDPAARLDLAGPDEYAARFRALLDDAVGRQTRGAGPAVGLFLSGGLDSSAIAAVGARRHREGGPAVSALSLVFPGLACDESAQIADVVARWSLAAEQHVPSPEWRTVFEAEVDRYADTPQWPNGVILETLRARARAIGLRIVLTGYGGDEWFTGSVHHTTDLLRAGRWLAAGRQILHDATLPGRGFSRLSLARVAVAPLLSPAVKGILRPLGGRPPVYDWIRPEFAAGVGLRDRLARREDVPPFETFAQRDMYRAARGPAQVIGDELEERSAAAAGIEQRQPFYDRPLAEFGMALPEEERWRDGETKAILRRACRADLPPSVLNRTDKAEFSATYVAALDGLGGAAFFDDLTTERAGWVDGAAIRRRYGEMFRLYSRGEESYIGLLGSLWSTAALELWVRRVA